jgi:hypothetical protein
MVKSALRQSTAVNNTRLAKPRVTWSIQCSVREYDVQEPPQQQSELPDSLEDIIFEQPTFIIQTNLSYKDVMKNSTNINPMFSAAKFMATMNEIESKARLANTKTEHIKPPRTKKLGILTKIKRLRKHKKSLAEWATKAADEDYDDWMYGKALDLLEDKPEAPDHWRDEIKKNSLDEEQRNHWR